MINLAGFVSLTAINFVRDGQLLQKAFMLAMVFGLEAFACGHWQIAAAQTKPATTTTLAVTSGTSLSPVSTVSSGSVVTLTATVTAGSTPLTVGQVSFCDASAKACTDIHRLGLAQLTKAGTAIMKFRPGPGTHQYKGVFGGTTQYSGSSSTIASLAVTGPIPTTTVLAETMTTGNYTLTGTVYGNGMNAPGGDVTFLNTSDGNAVLGNAKLGNPTAGFNLVALPGTSALLSAAVMGVAVIATGDFNGDGIPDLAVGNEYDPTGPLSILLGAGDGTFNPVSKSYSSVFSSGVTAIAVGDFNCDGKVDLAVSAGSSINILLGNGDGTFIASSFSWATGSVLNSIAVADFDGDGIPDLAVAASASGVLSILLGKGDATFTAKYKSLANSVTSASAIAIADFNGDGIADVAVLCTGMLSTLALYLGKGDGTLTLNPYGPIPADEFAVADFNGDGIPDLAAVAYSSLTTLTISILTGKGDGTFTLAGQPSLGVSSQFPAGMVAADFNGDGIADLALQIQGDGPSEVTVFRGDGAGGFAATGPASTLSPASNGMAAGDWNGDGFPDLAVVVQANGGLNETVDVLQSVTQIVTAAINGITFTPDSGSFQVVASYPGDADNQASLSAPVTLSAPLAAPSITVSLSSSSISTTQALSVGVSVSGAPGIPTPQGTVILSGGGYTAAVTTLSSAGTATISVAAGYLALGSDTLTVTYTPSSSSASLYTSATQTATVMVVKLGTAGSTVTVSPSAAVTTDQQNINVNVSVAGGQGAATPTGSVALASGSYSAQMSLSNGEATFAIAAGTLSAGADTLTATYSGDATYAAASGTATVTVSPVLMAATSPSPIAPGGSDTASITLTAGSSYSGTLNISCTLTTSPANAQSPPSCTLNPSTATIAAGGNATTTLTVKTTAATSAMLIRSNDRLWGRGTEAAAFAALLMIGLRARRRRWLSILALLVTTICVVSGGCGGSHSTPPPPTPGTTAGNYVFTVKAADSKDATIATSANVNVTVQ